MKFEWPWEKSGPLKQEFNHELMTDFEKFITGAIKHHRFLVTIDPRALYLMEDKTFWRILRFNHFQKLDGSSFPKAFFKILASSDGSQGQGSVEPEEFHRRMKVIEENDLALYVSYYVSEEMSNMLTCSKQTT